MKMQEHHYDILRKYVYELAESNPIKKLIDKVGYGRHAPTIRKHMFTLIFEDKVLGENHMRWLERKRILSYDPEFRYQMGDYNEKHIDTAMRRICDELFNRKSMILLVDKQFASRVADKLRKRKNVWDLVLRRNVTMPHGVVTVFSFDCTDTTRAMRESISKSYPFMQYLHCDHDKDGKFSLMPANVQLIANMKETSHGVVEETNREVGSVQEVD